MFLCLRLENLEGKWYIQHAEASVLQEFPRECFFEKSFQVLNIALNSAPMGYYKRNLFLFQFFYLAVEIAFEELHFALAVNLKLFFGFLDSLLMRDIPFAHQYLAFVRKNLII